MKNIILMVVMVISTITINAQIKNPQTVSVKVNGNCGMCQTTIEKAANKKKISKAIWNQDSKMATITFDTKKTNLEAVLKNIALAGYDNEKFRAPDAAYNKLPGCCQYDREKKAGSDTAMVMNNHQEHNNTTAVNATPQANQMQSIFNNYFMVKDALVKSDANKTAENAKTLLSALNAIKMETLKMDEHMAFMKVENDLKTDAQHISETKDIEHQRDHFTSLSKNMYTLIKAVKTTDKVYLQHCPMYNDGKGADWLSKENAIKNPYYGSMMLSCGKTVETIQ